MPENVLIEKEPILIEFVKKVNVQWKIENCTLP